MSTRKLRLPDPPLPCQPSSYRLARQWRWGGRPCSFPELPSGQCDRVAVESRSAAAAAGPHVDPRQRDRPARCHSLHLPRLRLRPRCRRPWEASAPSWHIRHHTWPMPSVCGGSSRQRCQQRPREGSNMRFRQARRGLWAWAWCEIRRASWRGQWPAAHRVGREK